MNAVANGLATVSATLDQAGRRWALIGGLAVSCHVDPRFTRDIDVAVAVDDDANAEALVRFMASGIYRIATAIEQQAVGRLATVRLVGAGSATSDLIVNLMFASSGIEAEICDEATRLEALPGVVVPVASRAHLIAMKLLSVDATRLQDALDLRALLRVATDAEVAEASAAARLITRRGFNRGRDLEAMLREYLP